MPKFDIFNASVVVDDVEQTEYDVVTDNEKKTVTCWIQSEAGKAFSVRWSYLSPYPYSSIGHVRVDGTYAGGMIVDANQTTISTVSAIQVTPTTERSLIFSGLELTDDDAYLHSGNLEDLGEICLEFWKIRIKKATTTFTRADVSQHHVKVHETVKKGMAHRVNFGEEKSIPDNVTLCDTVDIKNLANFVFKYRSIDILRADGIAPPLPNIMAQKNGAGKRNADALENESADEEEEEEEEEVDDGIEERAEAELKILLERANQIQSMLAKKAAKTKAPSKKRVKTEGCPVTLPNEIIDLT